MRSLPSSVVASSLAAAALLLVPAEALAGVKEITPADNLVQEANALMPGDELVLGGGTYNITQLFAITVNGTEQAPIVIRAKDGEVPIITRPDANQNTINVVNSTYLILRGLEVLGGSHGIRLNNSSFITVEGCHIHETADVGLSANVPNSKFQGLRLMRNHIHDTGGTGEGMYLGCNSNGCQMWDSLIEGNHIHHTNAADVSQGDGIEIKEGSYANVVRDNVIHDTNYPCIITYSTVGNGGPNVLERNVLWGCGDHGIQSAANAVIRNNIILGAAADGIRNQPHQAGSPANLEIVHNTILAPQNSGIRSDGIVGSVLIANNAVYAQNGVAIRAGGDLGGLVVAGNVGMGGTQGISMGYTDGGGLAMDFVSAAFSNNVPNDVFPKAGSALIGAGDAGHAVADDFNGTPRQGSADAGAYRFDAAGNPGWVLSADFKDVTGSSGGGGTGGAGTGGNGTGGAGTGGSGQGASGGASTGGAGGGSAGGDTGGSGGGSDGGCGCRTAGGEGDRTALLGLLAPIAILLGRRSRRRANRGG